jgi:hypothetical protein
MNARQLDAPCCEKQAEDKNANDATRLHD